MHILLLFNIHKYFENNFNTPTWGGGGEINLKHSKKSFETSFEEIKNNLLKIVMQNFDIFWLMMRINF